MISTRTRDALAGAKARGVKLGGPKLAEVCRIGHRTQAEQACWRNPFLPFRDYAKPRPRRRRYVCQCIRFGFSGNGSHRFALPPRRILIFCAR